MTNRRLRVLSATALSAAALALAAPGVAQAGGTDDPKYDHPPTSSSPDKPLNEKRAPVQQCPGGAANGEYSANPSYFPIELGESGPLSFDFTFDTKGIPDKYDILYEGKQVYTTGWRGDPSANNQGHQLSGDEDDTISVRLPAGRSSRIEVRVITDDTGTLWSFNVACPS